MSFKPLSYFCLFHRFHPLNLVLIAMGLTGIVIWVDFFNLIELPAQLLPTLILINVLYALAGSRYVSNQAKQAKVARALCAQHAFDLSQPNNVIENAIHALADIQDSQDKHLTDIKKIRQSNNQLNTLQKEASALFSQTPQATENIKQALVDINDIVVLMEGITFKANLLALNAVTEAAKMPKNMGFKSVATQLSELAAHAIEIATKAKTCEATSSQTLTQVSEQMAQEKRIGAQVNDTLITLTKQVTRSQRIARKQHNQIIAVQFTLKTNKDTLVD